MTSDSWPLVPVGEVCDIYDGPHATPSKTTAGPIFLGISNIANGRLDLGEVEHLSEDDFITWTRRVTPQANDVVFSYETRLGEAALIPTDLRCCLGRRMALMRADTSKVDPRYLHYAYLGPEFQEVLRSRTVHGSTVDRIPLIEFPIFPIRIPPLPVQRDIARVLGALDDKIKLNQQMNATLEAMARALFKSWFIDFDPVRALAVGRRPVGMDTDMASLWPQQLEESGAGEIPHGWETKPLDSVAHFLNGLALQKYPPSTSGWLPVIKIAELRRGVTATSDRASAAIDPRYIVHDGDVLFAWSGSLETCIWCGGTGALNQHLFKVTSELYPKWFFYLWIRQYLPEFQAIAADKATTMGHIQRHHLTQATVLVPPPALLERMGKVISPLMEKQVANQMESRVLTKVRDTILPKLLSGEVRVKDADVVVAGALA